MVVFHFMWETDNCVSLVCTLCHCSVPENTCYCYNIHITLVVLVSFLQECKCESIARRQREERRHKNLFRSNPTFGSSAFWLECPVTISSWRQSVVVISKKLRAPWKNQNGRIGNGKLNLRMSYTEILRTWYMWSAHRTVALARDALLTHTLNTMLLRFYRTFFDS